MVLKEPMRAVLGGPKHELIEAPRASATAGPAALQDRTIEGVAGGMTPDQMVERGIVESAPPTGRSQPLPGTEPLTPEEMYRVLTSTTAFQGGVPKGRLLGHGNATRAMLQLIDRDGLLVTVEFGRNDGKVHAEEHAIARLRRQLAGRRDDVRGGRLLVVVNQHVCSSRCAGALRRFAEELGLERVDSHVFVREAVKKSGEAAPRRTFDTQTQPSVEGKKLRRIDEPIYQRPAPPPSPAPSPAPAPISPVQASPAAVPEGLARRLWKTARSYGSGARARARSRNAREAAALAGAGLIVALAEAARRQLAEDQAVESLQKKMPEIDGYLRSNPGKGVLVVSAFHKVQIQEHSHLDTSFTGQSLVLGASTEEEARTLLEWRRKDGQMTSFLPGAVQDYVEEYLIWIPPL